MVHSFYAEMGGFAVDVRDEKLQFLADRKCCQFILPRSSFIWLAKNRLDLIPNLSQADIRDKSKANGLAKTLVCLQAIWFCVQCIGRLSQRLTVCLLELNTFAHAICTLLIYVLWWDKPLDVEEPSLLQGDSLKEVSAFMLVASSQNSIFAKKSQNRRGGGYSTVTLRHDIGLPESGTSQSVEIGEGPFQYPLRLQENHTIRGYRLYPRSFSERTGSTYVDLNSTELACLRMAIEEAQRYPPDTVGSYPSLNFRTPDWPTAVRYRASMFSSFMFAGLCYGGLHLTAWSAPFPNPVQQFLWRLCALGLVASGPLVWVFVLPVVILAPWRPNVKSTSLESMGAIFNSKRTRGCEVMNLVFGLALLVFLVCLALFYVLCRVFLVVECFIALGHLPDSVYQVPKWSQYFPHIS